jgi:hypothetical protein
VKPQQQSRWRPTSRQVLWAVVPLALVFIIVICGFLFGWEWTGFTGRTLWDWLKLLLAVAIPAVLAFYGQRISRLQYLGQQEAEEKRAQDEALQAYLDKMTALLVDKELGKPADNEDKLNEDAVRTIAWARTKTVLRRLDGNRKGAVVRFLREARLIEKGRPVIRSLRGAELVGAILERSVLEDTALDEVDLREAILDEANLTGADLCGANLTCANLTDAILVGADLYRARLTGAYLDRANLKDAQGVTQEQVAQAKSLEGATMPNGQKYEDWLKSKGSGEDGENGGPS